MSATFSTPERGVLTLALSKPFYLGLACNLARSFHLRHPDTSIRFTIVTDLTDSLPGDLSWCEVVRVEPGKHGVAFKPKLSLDLLAVAPRTLFIDSDCLVYEPLDRLFTRFAGCAVATVGTEIREGEWFGDVASLCRHLEVRAIPKFNGGLYYLERGEISSSVYRRARELAGRYDELGLIRLRGHPNDELLMAAAMSLHGLAAVPDDGTFMSDPQSCPGPSSFDVLSGRRRLVNPPPPSPRHQAWYPFTTVSPAIVHFLGENALRYPYRTEAKRLECVATGTSRWLAEFVARFSVHLPGWISATAKRLLRPAYHSIFGTRPVDRTPRDQIA